MSIDTLNKRASTSQFGLWDAIAPTPDGSLAVLADRNQCNWVYNGFDVAGDFLGGNVTTPPALQGDIWLLPSISGWSTNTAALTGQPNAVNPSC